MADGAQQVELVFEPQNEGGYHIYAPDLPGLHTQGDDLDDAMANASEAVALYVEGLREDSGRSTAAESAAVLLQGFFATPISAPTTCGAYSTSCRRFYAAR